MFFFPYLTVKDIFILTCKSMRDLLNQCSKTDWCISLIYINGYTVVIKKWKKNIKKANRCTASRYQRSSVFCLMSDIKVLARRQCRHHGDHNTSIFFCSQNRKAKNLMMWNHKLSFNRVQRFTCFMFNNEFSLHMWQVHKSSVFP